MADDRDPKVSAAYRALGAEAPPRALDEAVLAASRRPPRSWPQRWAVPLSLAAVLVLSVVVTLRIQHEQPEIATAEAPPAVTRTAPQEAPPLKLKNEDQLKSAAGNVPKSEVRRTEPKPFAEARSERAPAAAGAAQARAVPPPPAALGELASRRDAGRGADTDRGDSALRHSEDRAARDAVAAARAPQVGATFARPRSMPAPEPAKVASVASAASPAAAPAPAAVPVAKSAAAQAAKLESETPEQEFERIAQLRREGRHDEADKAFLEFRKRYPDFKITEEMLRRVERR